MPPSKDSMNSSKSITPGPEYAAKYKTLIYLAGSASAEIIADIAMCPMVAVNVRMPTKPWFASGLSDGFPKLVKSEGFSGCDPSLTAVPLLMVNLV
ncbi:hypothetical protein QQ045_005424 [Rhodiola kirilowii]